LLIQNIYGSFNQLASNLRTELDQRFNFIMNPDSLKFDGTFAIATALNPDFMLCLEQKQFDLARKELKLLVGFLRDVHVA
jgi:hypothetical protein